MIAVALSTVVAGAVVAFAIAMLAFIAYVIYDVWPR